MVKLSEIQQQYEEYQQKSVLTLSKQQKDQIIALAKDLPKLWNAPTTNSKDKKRILRLLINDITVERDRQTKIATLHVRWQGGAMEDIQITIPLQSYEKWRHPEELIQRIRELSKTMNDQDIVKKLNQEGLKTNKDNPFTKASISWIRFKHRIPSPCLQRSGELSITEVAKILGVSHHVVRYWIEREILPARRAGTRLWITLPKKKESELRKWVKNSTKIAQAKVKSQKKIVGGAI